jgi:hypothetical protein
VLDVATEGKREGFDFKFEIENLKLKISSFPLFSSFHGLNGSRLIAGL